MRKNKILAGALVAAMTVTMLPNGCSADEAVTTVANTLASDEVEIQKAQYANPIGGYDTEGNLMYGGDPAVMVDGDTVYLYTGMDCSTDSEVGRAIYNIKGWTCYSTKDLKNWKHEGQIMNAGSDISWSNDSTSAWAAQTVKYNGKYYFYYCTWDKTSQGKQSIGVAVSDSPTGPFVDKGEPIVKGTVTEPQSSNWNDIDPTVWIEKDENGEEHRYLAWGNGKYYICELNEDMISVKDLDGNGKITCGTSYKNNDIIEKSVHAYTEAPWLYRRQDKDGNYYGKYYLFYASGWREGMAYSTTDDLIKGDWTFGNQIAPPNATSNTNHMGVMDFKGETYFIYHNGALQGGNGYRRIANITKINFNEDGSIDEIPETASGIWGEYTAIYTKTGSGILSHENFTNSTADKDYPYNNVAVGANGYTDVRDAQWVITAGKADRTKAAYVSIQSENKPGLYITANNDKDVTLAQDTDGKDATLEKQTFRTVKALDGSDGVSFESVYKKGRYLSIYNGKLCLTDGSDKVSSTFMIGVKEGDKSLCAIDVKAEAQKVHEGDKQVKIDVQSVIAKYADGTEKEVKDYILDTSVVNTNKLGEQNALVSYTEGDITRTIRVPVTVFAKAGQAKNLKVSVKYGKKYKTIKLNWSKVKGAAGYEIYYSTKQNKGYEPLGDIDTNKLQYEDTDNEFKKGKTYYFKIKTYIYNDEDKEYGKDSKIVKVKIKK